MLETLMAELPEIVYVCDPRTHGLLYLNEAAKAAFGRDGANGSRHCYEVLQGRDTPCEFCRNEELAYDRFRTWEDTNPVTGRHYVLRDKLVDWDGTEARFELAFDMTEKERERARFEHLAKAGDAVVACIKLLSADDDIASSINRSIAAMGEFLEAERMMVLIADDGVMSARFEWCAPNVASLLNRAWNLPLDRLKGRTSLVASPGPLIVQNTEELRREFPRETVVLGEAGIERLAVVPLVINGKLIGLLEVDNPPLESLDDVGSPLVAFGHFVSSTMKRDAERKRIELLTWRDALTGVGSRPAFYRDYQQGPFSRIGVVEVDADGMRLINAREGREAGDELLVRMADLLAEAFGRHRLYRVGDDEFVVAVVGVEEASFVATAIALSRKFDAEGVTASLGYAWRDECSDIRELVIEADQKMKRAKEGRSRARASGWNPADAVGASALIRPGGAAEAIANGAMAVHVQPQVSSVDRRVLGVESLVRYTDPLSGGSIPPSSFIPALEDMNEVSVIDYFVLERTCEAVADWRARGLVDDAFSAAVNFSRRTVEAPGFAQKVGQVTKDYGLPPHAIEVEVTESARENDSQGMRNVVNDLRQAGFRVAIDDFGVDNANVSLFASMRFDVLKIDGSLVKDIEDDEWKSSIVSAVVSLCNHLGIDSVVECVEWESQFALLQSMKCTRIQGFLTGRPVPIEEFERACLLAS